MSAVRMTRHYLKTMLANKAWGRVVFVSSESGIYVPKEMVHYGFSKAALLYIARGAAEQTRSTGITVNSVLPGPTWVETTPGRRAPRQWGRRSMNWWREPSANAGRGRCCSVLPGRRRSPTSSAICARKPRARLTARPCASMAASSPIRSDSLPPPRIRLRPKAGLGGQERGEVESKRLTYFLR